MRLVPGGKLPPSTAGETPVATSTVAKCHCEPAWERGRCNGSFIRRPIMNDGFHSQLLDSVPDGVFTVDAEWRVTSFNRAAEQITGVRRQEAIGRPCCEVFRASICESACALKQTLATRRPISNKLV